MLPDHVARLLSLSDRDLALRDGEQVFGTGSPVRYLFVVRAGSIQMVRRRPDGAALVVQQVLEDGLVAEASVFAQRYHCDGIARGQTLLARIPKSAALDLQQEEPGWLQAFAAHLASEVQRARGRAELLSLKRVGERLDAWLTLYPGGMPERGRWADWANELGVSPEALYRELARRRGGRSAA